MLVVVDHGGQGSLSRPEGVSDQVGPFRVRVEELPHRPRRVPPSNQPPQAVVEVLDLEAGRVDLGPQQEVAASGRIGVGIP